LENAVIYSEPHAGREVTVGVDTHNDQLLFFVADQGIGIPAGEQELIFTKFYRATNAYKFFQNASGLSLYIVRHFVELHGGNIWFDSQEGVGSNFYFSIPLTRKDKK
jgi:signal transduction histidine kinase